MRVLIISATEKEVNQVLQKISSVRKRGQWLMSGNIGHLEVDFLVAGIGLPAVIFRLTSLLIKESYDLIINIGIAGSFKSTYPIGSVVNVVSERFGDIGIDDHGQFKTLFEMSYLDQNSSPFTCGVMVNNFDFAKYKILNSLPKANGITVNTTSGSEELINKRVAIFNPDIETMEGAGVFYVCQLYGLSVLQLRSVSNIVEPRNPKNWNVPLAIIKLSEEVIFLLNEIEGSK